MAVAAGAAVVGWITGGVASSAAVGAAAAVAGAITTAAVTGAMYGAVIGAGMSLVRGENPLKGALKGGLIGGVSGGILKGVGIATGFSPVAGGAVDASVSADVPTGAMSMGSDAASLAHTEAVQAGTALPVNQASQSGGLLSDGLTRTKNFLGGSSQMSPEKANIYAGIGQGAAQGIAGIGAAMIQSDEAKELAEWKEKQIALNRAANRSGEFGDYTARINIPNRWDENLKRRGLLN